MANTKRNNNWLMSSFDNEPVKRVPQIKRKISQEESCSSYFSKPCEIIPKKKSVSNLSALLQACEPQNSSELVISRQKRQEILKWFQNKVKRERPAALILSGPSGCGKTVATKVLAKENKFNVIEWITPMDQMMDENNRIIRQGDKFEDFLIRATRYSSVLTSYSSRLLLVKDFPNVYFEDKESFYTLLEKYFKIGKEPIVFICPDSRNSMLIQKLFPPEVRQNLGIDLITVNPVTQTAMKSALKRIVNILNSIAGHMLHVSQRKVDEILSNNIGDIRNAVLNLIFISLKVPQEQENDCNSREEALGLLHGVGRVINPKRVETGNSWKFAHDPDDIAAYFQSNSTVFSSFIQENYLNTIQGIEEANVCADILSLTDVLNSEWRDYNLTKATLSFCVRGIMVTNEKPVSGWNPVRKPPNNSTDKQRCLTTAEVNWYKSKIKPSKDMIEVPEVPIEEFIE